MLFIKNIIKYAFNILNRNIYRIFTSIKKITGTNIDPEYLADQITMRLNRLVKNEFIPNPKEHLYIEVSNICNLRCKFCAYSKSTNKKLIMSNEKFFEIVKKATNFGYENFGLTPITGEVFVDKNFIDKLDFLENHQKVKSYSFFTNFTLTNKEIVDWLINAKKLNELYISLYGHDFKSFSKFTGGNEKIYKNLISNLKYLLKQSKKINFKLSFGLSTYPSFNSVEKYNSDLCQVVKNLLKLSNCKITIVEAYYNWGGYITQDDVKGLGIVINNPLRYYKNGACSLLFYKNQVLVDGRINACACRDVNVTLKIGNLNTQSFEEIYSPLNKDYINIIKGQQKGNYSLICKNCDFYRSIYKNYEIYHKYKKKPIILKDFYIYSANN